MRLSRGMLGWLLWGLVAGPLMARPTLETVPVPATEAMDVAAREQLDDERAAVEALLTDAATPSVDLASALGRYGQIAFAYQQSDTAHAAFVNATRVAPDDPRWWHYVGLTALESGQFEAARAAFATALSPGTPWTARAGWGARETTATRLRLGEVYLHKGEPQAARAMFADVLQGLPGDGAGEAAARYGLGRADVADGEFEAAVQHFRAALARAPEADVVYYHLGLAYRELGRMDDARAALRQRGTITPVIPDPLFAEARRLASGAAANLLRATRALRRDEWSTAIGFFEQALTAAPDDAQAWRGLATALDRAGRTSEAVARLQSALAGPQADALAQDPELQLYLGKLFGRLGRDADALAAFRAAVTAAPDLRDARFNLGLALKRASRLDESVEQLTRAVTLDPSDTLARLELAGVLGLVGRAEDAIAMIEAARDVDPDEPRVDLERALTLGRAGRFADAATAYDRFLARVPDLAEADVAEAHVGRAMALLFADQCARAVVRIDESLRAVPEDLRLEHLLARVLATCPNPAGRDGARALRLAEAIMAKEPTLDHGETVAMALAELGRFDQAVNLQGRIVAEAERQGWAARLPSLRARLVRYQRAEAERAPWRQ